MVALSSLQNQANTFFRQRSTSPEAVKVYQQVLDLQPSDTVLIKKIAAVMHLAPNTEENLPLLERLQTLVPENLSLAIQICDTYIQNNKYSDAKNVAQHILLHDPKHVYANHCLGCIAEIEGRFSLAAEYYSAVDRWLDVLRVCVAADDIEGAAEAEMEMSEDTLSASITSQLLGWLYFKKGDLDKARTYWSQDIETNPDNAGLMTVLKTLTELSDTSPAPSLDGLPLEAQTAAKWLSEVSSGGTPELSTNLTESYIEALAATRAMVSLSLQKTDAIDTRPQSPLVQRARAIQHAHQGEWLLAAKLAKDDVTAERLYSRIVQVGIQSSIAVEDWTTATCLLTEHLTNHYEVAWYDTIAAALWKAGHYKLLLDLLQKHPVSDTALFHRLAIVCTQLAIQKDNEGNGASEWNVAVGYWAVALSDANYWKQWGQVRSAVYAKDVRSEQITELREQTVPDFVRRYHLELSAGKKPEEQLEHHYYAVRLKTEIEFTAAMRHVIRVAASQNVKLPAEACALISPLLITTLAPANTIQQLCDLLIQLKVSPHEAQLVRKAFSPLVQAYVWMEAGEYANALPNLRTFQQQHPKDKDIEREIIYVLQQSAERHAQTGRWDESINAAEEILKFRPGDWDAERAINKAACGWAESHMKQGDYQAVIDWLKSTAESLTHKHSELDTLMAEALVKLSLQVGVDNNADRCLALAEEALSLCPQHKGAANIVANIYHNRAMKQFESKNYMVALANAQQAMHREPDPATARLLANIQTALQKWDAAYKAASQAFDLDPSQTHLHFLIYIRMSHARNLYEKQLFSQAIDVLQPLLELEYDPDVVSPHLMLSAVFTDYGVWSINQNRRTDARQQWTRALKLDPSNTVAKQNLRVIGVMA